MSAKYMDDIKLYATSERDVNSLIHWTLVSLSVCLSVTGIDIYCLKKQLEIHWLPIQALVLFVVHFALKKSLWENLMIC